MLSSILVTLVIVAALVYAFPSGRKGGLIAHHSYNNRHSDAAGARDDHLG